MILLRQEGRCFYCGKDIFIHADQSYQRKATLDHKTPLAFGGEPFGDNVVAACRVCNHAKGHLDAESFIAVRNDHERRKELLREAQAKIAAMPKSEKEEIRRRLKLAVRESKIRLQIALGPIIREHRRRIEANVAQQVEARP